jgi:hypothetical protein
MIAVLLAELGATVTLLCGIQGRRFIFSNSIFFLSQFYCERWWSGSPTKEAYHWTTLFGLFQYLTNLNQVSVWKNSINETHIIGYIIQRRDKQPAHNRSLWNCPFHFRDANSVIAAGRPKHANNTIHAEIFSGPETLLNRSPLQNCVQIDIDCHAVRASPATLIMIATKKNANGK